MSKTSIHRENITLLEKIIRDSYTPLQSGVSGVKYNWDGWTIAFANKKNQSRTIESLKKQNNNLVMQNQKLLEYRAEALRLRKILAFAEPKRDEYNLISARVVARNSQNWYKYLVIDQGQEAGVVKDMAVISPQGLVGRVGSVSRNSAQVILITDRETAVGAILQKTRETRGIVEGLGNSSQLRMVNIPYYSKIEKGNIVVTSGLSKVYPKGIAIGKISKVTKEPSGLLLTAQLKPMTDFDKLEEVLVIKDYFPPVEALEEDAADG
ncbi:MAG: rod shape-determining protein MreC [Syntrophomonadaceae bacterium]|nr:rod shape-determining protein MreC [Syntrophomonadaceae bacterium]